LITDEHPDSTVISKTIDRTVFSITSFSRATLSRIDDAIFIDLPFFPVLHRLSSFGLQNTQVMEARETHASSEKNSLFSFLRYHSHKITGDQIFASFDIP
jgi:hypothetical protein